MENNVQVPYIVHEGTMARIERNYKRLWILCVILCFLLAFSWGGFMYYIVSFETVTETITETVTQSAETNGEGNVDLRGISYGESETDR